MNEAEAREALTRWREVDSQRDSLIRAARAAGISKYEIHQLTGIARTTIDRILNPGAPVTTHTAVIDAGNAVTVIVSDQRGDREDFPAVPLGNTDDLQGHAERFLAMEGWHLTGAWEADSGTLRAPVKRGSRVNEPGMRDAIVKGTAQYILRGHLHTKKPPHTEAQILAHVRYELRGAEAYGYTFPDDTPEQIAAEADKLADDVAARNPNWDQWAFGN